MRRPRVRISIRSLASLIAVVALLLVGWRVYREGPEAHWMLLKLRYGDVETRRAAAAEVHKEEARFLLRAFFEDMSGPPNPQTLEVRHRHRRWAELLLPALIRATKDPDPACRINALKASSSLATFYATELLKDRVFHLSLAAMHDPDESVRAAAMASVPGGLGRRDAETLIEAYRTALSDPAVAVRRAAAERLGMFAVGEPEIQADVATILMGVLASREDPGVRAKAISGLWVFGLDRRRGPDCPDVVPALVATLRDPAVEVRRKAAEVLGRTTIDTQCRPVSDWDLRKATILPAIERALMDEDRTMREEAALALFGLGRREPGLIELIEKGAGDTDRARQHRFAEAIAAWKEESEPKAAAEEADAQEEATPRGLP
jgi:hypothetical protein